MLNHHPNALFYELTRQFLIPLFVFIGFFDSSLFVLIFTTSFIYMLGLLAWTLISVFKINDQHEDFFNYQMNNK